MHCVARSPPSDCPRGTALGGRCSVSPSPIKETSLVSSWEPRNYFVRSAPISTVGKAVRGAIAAVPCSLSWFSQFPNHRKSQTSQSQVACVKRERVMATGAGEAPSRAGTWGGVKHTRSVEGEPGLC